MGRQLPLPTFDENVERLQQVRLRFRRSPELRERETHERRGFSGRHLVRKGTAGGECFARRREAGDVLREREM